MSARLRSEGVVLVPALLAVALLVFWAADGGGYEPTVWEPSGLVLLGLLAATVLGLGPGRLRLAPPLALALGLLGAYVAFSYLSIAWAPAQGEALDGANRALVFLAAFALFALLPWRAWTALTTLSAFALGIGVLAVVTLVRLGDADAVPGMFIGARLDAPIGYTNGSAALLLAETVLAVALASRRELPVLLRGLLLGLAAAALQLSVLCASRGWLFALPIVIVLAAVLVPGRVRLALWALPPFAGAALALPALLDVYERANPQPTVDAIAKALVDPAAHAGSVALLVSGVVLVVGLAIAAADRGVDVPAAAARAANRVAAGLAVLAVLAGVVVGLALTDGRPDRKLVDYWDRSNGYQAADPNSSRFGTVGSGRPDFWRVSLRAFADRPLGGLGQDNFSAYYLRERDSAEQPRWTHSLELRLLAHTGLVGTLLFAGFLAAALAAALAGRRRAGPTTSAAAAIALLPLVVWFVHGSVDWFWEIPALSGPAFAFLALGGATMGRSRAAAKRPSAAPLGTARRVMLAAAVSALTLAGAAAIALPYLAEREVATASSDWAQDPARAFEQLDRAARLNPLSSRPELVAGVIAFELGDARRAERRFANAVARDDEDWFAWFGRGLARSALEQPRRARANYERARSLDPDEPLVAEALDRVGGANPLTAREAFGMLRRDVQQLTSSLGAPARV